jgi:hypothetical protein
MGQDISSVLTFAVGVAISPVPTIAVILMLFSRPARVAFAGLSLLSRRVERDGHIGWTARDPGASVNGVGGEPRFGLVVGRLA